MTMMTSDDPRSTRTAGGVPPWFRDQYSALRAGAGPRWEQARATVAPVVADTTHRVRHDLVPAAAQFSTRVAGQALDRSAPLRAQVTDRATATLAAARGQVTPTQIQQLAQSSGKRGHRRFWLVSAVAALGAALGTAAVLWQRSHSQDWVEDDAVHDALDTDADAKANARAAAVDAEFVDDGSDNTGQLRMDDPSDPDGGVTSDDPSSVAHRGNES